MKIVIEFLTGQEKGTTREFSAAEVCIGRFSPLRENHIVFDPVRYRMVSREHASLRAVEDGYCLFDDKSANGTLLNGEEITEARLQVGDIITFGAEGPEIRVKYLTTPASLTYLSGPLKGEKKVLDEATVRIGRDDTNDVVFSDFMVSRLHARIEFQENAYWLIDEQSKNGTYVEGRKIDRIALKHGQILRFGADGPEMRFECQERKRKKPVYEPEPAPARDPEEYEPQDAPELAPEISRRGRRRPVYEPESDINPPSRQREPFDEPAPETNRRNRRREPAYEPEMPPPNRRRNAEYEPEVGPRSRRQEPAYDPDIARERRPPRASRYAPPGPPGPGPGRRRSRTEIIVIKAVDTALKKWKATVIIVIVAFVVITGVYAFHSYLMRKKAENQQREFERLYDQVNDAIKQREKNLADSITNTKDLSEAKLKELIAQNYEDIKKLRERELELKVKVYGKDPTVENEIKKIMAEFGADETTVPNSLTDDVAAWIRRYKPSVDEINRRRQDYWDTIVRIFEEQRLDKRMAYIAWVESAFVPDAPNKQGSGAMGMWQFMPLTAREYGLRVDLDAGVDERKDWEKSTKAAAQYIKYLSETIFGGKQYFLWVVASYDQGQGRTLRSITATERFLKPDELYWFALKRFPSETRDYVPKFLAAVIIGENRNVLEFKEVTKKAGD